MKKIQEAGLVDYYKFQTLNRMKRNYIASDEKKIEFEEGSRVTALSLDDLQGVFYLILAGPVLGWIAFVIEQCRFQFEQNDETKKQGKRSLSVSMFSRSKF